MNKKTDLWDTTETAHLGAKQSLLVGLMILRDN